MIPIRDINPSKGTPSVNYLVIALCILAFLYEISLGRRALEVFVRHYGLVPIRYSDSAVAGHFTVLEQIVPLFSSMFLHGGWLHLIGNMWVLYIFGDNVEGEFGHGGYLLFYLLSGLIAAVLQVLTNANSSIPTIGASGAIAGVMGAYFVLYPRARVLTIFPIFFFFYPLEVPAYVFLGFWFILQFFNGTLSLMAVGSRGFEGIAWWAHVGGFVGGIFLLFLLRKTRQGSRRRSSFEW